MFNDHFNRMDNILQYLYLKMPKLCKHDTIDESSDDYNTRLENPEI